MNQQIEERIEIIKSLKTTTGKADQSLEKRVKSTRIFGIISYALANFVLIFLIFITILAILDFGGFGSRWPKFALFVFMTISISIQAHFSPIDYLLSKHRKKLQNFSFSFDNQLNNTLRKQIDELNFHRFKPYWIIIPSLIIMISGILVVFASNDVSAINNLYWGYFKIPVLLVGILLFWNFNWKIYQVWENIKNAESSIQN